MIYFVKFGSTFKFILGSLFMCVIYIVIYFVGQHHDYFIAGCGVLVLTISILPKLVRLTWFSLAKRPVLTVNEFFIWDHFKNVQYYWDDIEEIIPTDSTLSIRLFEPEKYLNRIGYPPIKYGVKIGCWIFKKKPVYAVDMGMVAMGEGEYAEFLDLLNDYSIKAEMV